MSTLETQLLERDNTDQPTTAKLIRVLICDDHPLFAESLASLLNSQINIDVVAMASTMAEVEEIILQTSIDLAILDVHLLDDSGFEVAKSIQRILPDCKIMFLTGFASDEVIWEAVRLGAMGILEKTLAASNVIERVQEIAQGRRSPDPRTLAPLVERLGERGVVALTSLNATDFEILRLVAQGHSDKEISAMVYLSAQTVRNRVSRLLTILSKDNRTQLALLMNGLDTATLKEIAPR